VELSQVLEEALVWAKKNKPKSSVYHQAALANSVGYLVSRWSGGYGGPSIREHLCSHALVGDGENILAESNLGTITLSCPDGRLPRAGEWEFDAAVQFCKPICFETLSRYALKIVRMEHCFDDDPRDLEQIEKWEIEELKELSLRRKTGKLKQSEWEYLRYLREKHRGNILPPTPREEYKKFF